jgi:hypothetical protein
MSNDIRKPFADLIAFLESNKEKKISAILPQVRELCESKKKDSTIRKDESGKITHIFCYYHKEWEPVEWYGAKQSSHSGLNTMCKIGVNEWTKRQSGIKKAKEEVLMKVSKGEIKPEQVQGELERIEKESLKIIPRAKSIEALAKKEAAKKVEETATK